MFLFNKYLTKVADNFGSRLMPRIIAFFLMCNNTQSVHGGCLIMLHAY